jgi:hypothetical protein
MGYCPFQNYNSIADIFTTIPCPQSTDCQLWDDENQRCGMMVSDTIIRPENTHQSLMTYFESEANEPPAASKLINEFMGNEDADGNSYIYGYDFKISGTDVNKPNLLRALENNPDWTDPSIEITWNEYLNWIETGVSPI